MSDDDEKKTDKLPQEESSEDEEYMLDLLVSTAFPGGGKKYVLHRAAGADVLEIVTEHEMEGYLEIEESNETAMLYVKFPSDKGAIAGRLDHTGPRGERPVKHFHLSACKAHIDYGCWNGMIHRDENTPGVHFFGSMVTIGANLAKVGREDVSAENPFLFDDIRAVQLNEDEPEIEIGAEDEYLPGYKVLKKGYLGFTIFFVDEKDHYCSGRSAPVPLTLWFRPQLPDDTSCIPSDVREEIKKLSS